MAAQPTDNQPTLGCLQQGDWRRRGEEVYDQLRSRQPGKDNALALLYLTDEERCTLTPVITALLLREEPKIGDASKPKLLDYRGNEGKKNLKEVRDQLLQDPIWGPRLRWCREHGQEEQEPWEIAVNKLILHVKRYAVRAEEDSVTVNVAEAPKLPKTQPADDKQPLTAPKQHPEATRPQGAKRNADDPKVVVLDYRGKTVRLPLDKSRHLEKITTKLRQRYPDFNPAKCDISFEDVDSTGRTYASEIWDDSDIDGPFLEIPPNEKMWITLKDIPDFIQDGTQQLHDSSAETFRSPSLKLNFNDDDYDSDYEPSISTVTIRPKPVYKPETRNPKPSPLPVAFAAVNSVDDSPEKPADIQSVPETRVNVSPRPAQQEPKEKRKTESPKLQNNPADNGQVRPDNPFSKSSPKPAQFTAVNTVKPDAEKPADIPAIPESQANVPPQPARQERQEKRKRDTTAIEATDIGQIQPENKRQVKKLKQGNDRATNIESRADETYVKTDVRASPVNDVKQNTVVDVGNDDNNDDENDDVAGTASTPSDKIVLPPSLNRRPTMLPDWDEEEDYKVGDIVPELCADKEILKVQGEADTGIPVADETETDVDGEATRLKELLRDAGKAIEHFYPEVVEMARRFWKLDLPDSTDGQIEGMVRALMKHQWYAAFWILWLELNKKDDSDPTPVGARILADGVGLGKSSTMAGTIVGARWLEIAWNDVNDARKKKEYHRHLAEDGQDEDSVCPSNEPFGICCPCVNSNPSSQMKTVPGLVMLVVQPGLATNALQEIYKQIDMKHPRLNMRIIIQATKRQPKDKIISVRDGTGKIIHEIDFNSHRLENAEVESLISEMQPRVVLPEEGQSEDVEDEDVDLSMLNLSRMIVLTTSSSIERQILDSGILRLPFGRLIRDEFHKEIGLDTGTNKTLRQAVYSRSLQPDRLFPRVLFISATPHGNQLEDISPFTAIATLPLVLEKLREDGRPFPDRLPLMLDRDEREAWVKRWDLIKDPFWRHYTPAGLKKISQGFRLSDEDADHQTAKKRFARFLREVQIGRGENAEWFGEAIMDLPRLRYRCVKLSIGQQEKTRIEENVGLSKKQLELLRDMNPEAKQQWLSNDKKAYSLWNKLKKVALCPQLAELHAQNLITLLSSDVVTSKWLTTRLHKKSNPFRTHIRKIMNSPKINAAHGIVRHWMGRLDNTGRPAKGIIFVDSTEAVLCFHLWLYKAFPDIGSCMVYGGQPQPERDRAVERFQDPDNTENVRILIASYTVAGEGLTLTLSIFMLLAEPTTSANKLIQAIGRMRRYGNDNWKGLYVYALEFDDYVVEKNVIALRKGRIDLIKATQLAVVNDWMRSRGSPTPDAAGGHIDVDNGGDIMMIDSD